MQTVFSGPSTEFVGPSTLNVTPSSQPSLLVYMTCCFSADSSKSAESLVAPYAINEAEQFWVDNARWLENVGFRLRARYQPNRPPPQPLPWTEAMFNAEEVSLYGSIMDAVRISDNKPVMLKAVSRIIHPQEVKIGMYFSDKSIASDPRNHCIPIYDVFPVPDSEMDLIVMPVLRPFENPQFDTVGEVIAFIQQLLEGIQFMHEHLVAHGDCTEMNIMMDGSRMYPKGWNTLDPWQAREDPFRAAKRAGFRMQFWPKYYLIDFGLSHMYSSKRTVPPLERILRGGDKSAPEHAPKYKRANPFSTDIYYIGNLIRENFTERRNSSLCKRFSFLKPLVDSMVQNDPVKRPTIDDVVMQFDAVVRKNRRHLKFRAAACDLQHYQFTDQIPALFRRFTKYFVMRRSLPVLPHPERHLSPELTWMYSGPPTEYPEGQQRPMFLYIHDLDDDT